MCAYTPGASIYTEKICVSSYLYKYYVTLSLCFFLFLLLPAHHLVSVYILLSIYCIPSATIRKTNLSRTVAPFYICFCAFCIICFYITPRILIPYYTICTNSSSFLSHSILFVIAFSPDLLVYLQYLVDPLGY